MAKRFFIVGCGRSGTTMLQQALNRHSQIVIPPETRFFAFLHFSKKTQRQHLRRIAWDLGIDIPALPSRVRAADQARTLYAEIASLYLQRLGRSSVTCFGEKSGENLLYLEQINHLFPEAKIILVYRDGRDVALSLTKVPWAHSDLYVNFAVWLYYYRIQKRVMEASPANICLVKYEDVVANPELELRRVLQFLGLDYEPQVAEGHSDCRGIPEWELGWKARAFEKISTSRLGVWRQELSPVQIARLERWGGNALQSLGYELTTSGRDHLPLSFFPFLMWRIGAWRTGRALRALRNELWGSELASVNECLRMGAHGA